MKPRNAFERLVARYANGRALCNCNQAYYTNSGRGWIPDGKGNWEERNDCPDCQHGCSSNQIRTKLEIAERVEKEFILRCAE